MKADRKSDLRIQKNFLIAQKIENNKVKPKELQFGSRRRVWEGDMPPSALCAEAKIFFKIQEV